MGDEGLPGRLGPRLAFQGRFNHTKKLQDPPQVKLPDLEIRGIDEYLSQYFRPWKQGFKDEGKTLVQSLFGGKKEKGCPDRKAILLYPPSQNLLFHEMESLPFQKSAGLQRGAKVKQVKEEKKNIRDGLFLTQLSRAIQERFPIRPLPIRE
jgi:hypothetical protein